MTTYPDARREALAGAKAAVDGSDTDYAKRVIHAMHSRLNIDPPHGVNTDPDAQVSHCRDCASFEDSTHADFWWRGWGDLCAECSLSRIQNGGENIRRTVLANQTSSEGGGGR